MTKEGRIVKGVGGLYTVLCGDGTELVCPAKGLFRLNGQTPYVGDLVQVELEGESAVIAGLLPRRTLTVRPPVANIDQLLMVVSTRSPVPNALVLDRLIALAECKGIEPAIVFTKVDLTPAEPWLDIYRRAGFRTEACDLRQGVTLDGRPAAETLAPWFAGHVTALCGNSGVGKTTLLGHLLPEVELQTGEVSRKLGRGRHTTRQVELYPAPGGGFSADTPGFSSWDAESGELMTREALLRGFREFARFEGQCRFDDCSHTAEKGCAVIQAVKNGEIARSRFESYCTLYNEVRNLQEWQLAHRPNVIR